MFKNKINYHELLAEARAGNFQEVEELATELEQNLKKIKQHGQRASAIVKGMLEHARPSTSERQPTDLNALAAEYLNLAYESLREQAPAFEVELITDFEAGLAPVALVPPDIGRVLLNLYTNAFYAVQQKATVTDPDYSAAGAGEHPPKQWASNAARARQRLGYASGHGKEGIPALFHDQAPRRRHGAGPLAQLRHHHQRAWRHPHL